MTGKIKLVHSGGNAVSIAVPTSNPSSSEVEFKLPGSDGSANQVLKTDGSGNLSFGADQAGKILQVVTSTKNDTFTTTSSSFVDLTGMSRTITPSAASSKILILTTLHVGGNDSSYPAFALLRGSTILADGDYGTSNRTACTFGHYLPSQTTTNMVAHHFLDTPSYSLGDTLTYKIQVLSAYNSKQITINRIDNTVDASYSLAGTSNLTVMEVAA
tara:strand:+ start:692 stop:1336 length:645 start_codon:yes stop_codon:yes gene_type:complete